MKKGKWNIIVRTQGVNNKSELKNALYSIVAQRYKNLSVILVIHSNNENTIKKTKSFVKHFDGLIEIKTIVARKKQGIRAYPLNVGLRYVDGEYLSFLDHDDIYYPNMGEILIKAINNKRVPFALGESIQTIQKEKQDLIGLKYLYTESKKKRKKQKFNKPYLFLDNFIPFNSFILKSSIIGNSRFDEKLIFLEDWDFLKKIALKENFSAIQLETPVSEYRIRQDETDTYTQKNLDNWEKSRKITDKNFSQVFLTVSIPELLELRENYLSQIREYEEVIAMIKRNKGFILWEKIKSFSLVKFMLINYINKIVEKIRS